MNKDRFMDWLMATPLGVSALITSAVLVAGLLTAVISTADDYSADTYQPSPYYLEGVCGMGWEYWLAVHDNSSRNAVLLREMNEAEVSVECPQE